MKIELDYDNKEIILKDNIEVSMLVTELTRILTRGEFESWTIKPEKNNIVLPSAPQWPKVYPCDIHLLPQRIDETTFYTTNLSGFLE